MLQCLHLILQLRELRELLLPLARLPDRPLVLLPGRLRLPLPVSLLLLRRLPLWLMHHQLRLRQRRRRREVLRRLVLHEHRLRLQQR